MLSATAATAAVFSAAAPQSATADPGATANATTRLDRLYEQAEQATEQYNATQEHITGLRGEVTRLQERTAEGQERVNRMRDGLGEIAGAQYRGDGVDPALALLLSSDPDGYLHRAEALDRIGVRSTDRLRDLRSAQRSLQQRRAEATGKLSDLDEACATLQDRRRTVRARLVEAQRLFDTLPAAQRAAYRTGRGLRTFRTGGDLPDPSAPSDVPDLPAPSDRAARAVAAAREAVGSPYVWGSAGPSSFDCSGLMVYAYRQAGVSLPRTSQEQLHAGQRVPLEDMRPGDLVIYRGDASHVAMYVGRGQVIHAPYPGARVRYDAVDMLPVSGVTRP